MKQVKVWKCWKDFDREARKDVWIVASFDAVEQPTRYKMKPSHWAFHFDTFIEKSDVALTREDAIKAVLISLNEVKRQAQLHVIQLFDDIQEVERL